MALMSLTDSIFLDAEAREQPMHVGSLQLLRAPDGAGPEFARQMYELTLATSDIDARLTKRPVRRVGGVGPRSWETDPKLDLEHHVRHSALPQPGRIRELLALVSRLHGTMLHRSRPLWEANIIEGLEDGRFAVYTKMHHALVDGMAGMRMLRDGLSEDPDEVDMPAPLADHRSNRPPRGGAAVAESNPVKRVAGAVGDLVSGGMEAGRAVLGGSDAALRTLYRSFSDQAVATPYKAPRSMLNVPVTGARRFAADSWSLERIKAVRDATGCTFNDVVMGMSAGALRRYLLELDALPDEPLIAMVPVSLRSDADAGKGGNAVGLVLCNLGTHLESPEARMNLIRDSMEKGKLRLEGLTPAGIILLSALAVTPIALGPLYRFEPLRKPPFNLVISNVPGPRNPLYFNGARLEGLYPMSIVMAGQAMNITVTSYAGSLEVGITGCRKTMPSLQRLLTHLETSLQELEKL